MIQIIDSLSISFCRMMETWGIKGVILPYRAVGARNCPHPIMPHHPLLLPHPHRRPLQRLCWSNLQKRLVPPKIQVLSCQVSNQMIPRLSLCQGKYYCSFDVKIFKNILHKYFLQCGLLKVSYFAPRLAVFNSPDCTSVLRSFKQLLDRL